MKANAPEKINLPVKDGKLIGLIKDDGLPFKNCDENIEYTRTDVFIEKADKFISSFFHPDDTELMKVALDEFHKYMKGE